MRTLLGLGLGVLLAGCVFGQFRGNPTPVMTGGFGNVVYPGGTSATVPGLQRTTPNVVYPGGGGPHLYVPGSSPRPTRRSSGAAAYAYPVYIGAYGYGDSLYDSSASAPPAQQQQGNVTVVYPPQPAPVIINQYGVQGQTDARPQRPPTSLYISPSDETADQPSTAEPARYLLAFKDHTVYSSIAYWVEGDTLHYFTSGNIHNQVSLSLVDRDLTERLNKESGVDVRLPAGK